MSWSFCSCWWSFLFCSFLFNIEWRAFGQHCSNGIWKQSLREHTLLRFVFYAWSSCVGCGGSPWFFILWILQGLLLVQLALLEQHWGYWSASWSGLCQLLSCCARPVSRFIVHCLSAKLEDWRMLGRHCSCAEGLACYKWQVLLPVWQQVQVRWWSDFFFLMLKLNTFLLRWSSRVSTLWSTQLASYIWVGHSVCWRRRPHHLLCLSLDPAAGNERHWVTDQSVGPPRETNGTRRQKSSPVVAYL